MDLILLPYYVVAWPFNTVYWHYRRRLQDRQAVYTRKPLSAEFFDFKVTEEQLRFLEKCDAKSLRDYIVAGKISC